MNIFKVRTFFLISISSFLCFTCNDLNLKPDLSKGFIKYYGGSQANEASKIELTEDGGYVVVGTSFSLSNGSSDMYVVKTDKNGNLLWEKNFGGSGADSGKAIKVTPDNGFVVVGSINRQNKTSIYVVRIDNKGDSIWTKNISIAGINSNNSFGKDIAITTDQGYLIVGSTNSTSSASQAVLVKTNSSGETTLSIKRGFDGKNTYTSSVLETNTSSGNKYEWLGSSETSNPSGTFVLVRNRPDGQEELAYQKTETFIKELSVINGTEIRKKADGSYIISGTCINNGIQQAYLLKLGADLKDNPEKAWFKAFGNTQSTEGLSVDPTQDGGYVLLGTIRNDDKGKDYYLLKTDGEGNEEWHKTFGGQGDDYGVSVKQTKDGGFIMAGTFSLITTPENNKVICLIKTDSKGEIVNK